ncbi:hypothetical protein LK542_11775 [Massilia sp. IC2-477]|uniref:hypothetical protein n=1 Tax=unclassified Massilia TaxID=2609279 RepID=UPI001D11DF26|nr:MULTISPECIES: hypothetical protein [unclassified Massilia]MCC2956295.1 hypothetical protein [Massilia sp. IC2-477]MCC2972334.1 hypothetical protein [Massilia sp. IC2-476]
MFEIADNGDFRAGAPDGRQYRLVLAGESYQVAELGGRPVVARLADIEAALRANANDAGSGIMRALSAIPAFTPQRIVHKGPIEINGWSGEVYNIRGAEWEFDRYGSVRDPEGAPYYVVSRDPTLRQVGPALLAFTAGELAFGRHLLAENASRLLLDTLQQLAARGTLIESSENGLQLMQAEQAAIDPARLALPAPPLSREAVAALVRERRSPFRAIVAP